MGNTENDFKVRYQFVIETSSTGVQQGSIQLVCTGVVSSYRTTCDNVLSNTYYIGYMVLRGPNESFVDTVEHL